ncbi:MAG: hypothetical protein ACOX8S_05670 [Christensenellales bacterium]|jgi:hypothetical protein
MPDYKEMYYRLFRASQEAIDLIMAAQKECEEIYIAGESWGEKRIFPFPAESFKEEEQE